MIKFAKTDHVVTAFAESASGPGWANSPVWLVVRSQLDGTVRVECLQPDEQSAEMRLLYPVCAAANSAMTDAVTRLLRSSRKKKGLRK